jgi:hypothetical protein
VREVKAINSFSAVRESEMTEYQQKDDHIMTTDYNKIDSMTSGNDFLGCLKHALSPLRGFHFEDPETLTDWGRFEREFLSDGTFIRVFKRNLSNKAMVFEIDGVRCSTLDIDRYRFWALDEIRAYFATLDYPRPTESPLPLLISEHERGNVLIAGGSVLFPFTPSDLSHEKTWVRCLGNINGWRAYPQRIDTGQDIDFWLFVAAKFHQVDAEQDKSEGLTTRTCRGYQEGGLVLADKGEDSQK